MIVTQTEPNVVVAVSEGEIAQILDDGTKARQVIITNTGTNTITYKSQYSTDRTTWTDIAASATISPGTTAVISISRPESYVRLMASGNSTASITVSRQISFSGTFALTPV